jgi:magnesium transporter
MQARILEDKTCVTTSNLDAIRSAVESEQRVWLQVEREDLVTRELLASCFRLHPLVIEDLWHRSPLPKTADFDGFLQVVLHAIDGSSTPEQVKTHELDMFLAERFVITRFPESRTDLDEARVRRLMEKGPAWLAHAMIDRLVDGYVPLLDQFDQKIAELEGEIVKKAGTPTGNVLVNRIFALKRSLQTIRRISVHQREVLLQLSRGDYDEVPVDALPFFRDAYDHFLRISDLAESHRESLASLLDAFWSVQSHRMNEVMKRLTLMSTIMLPLTLIAGVYGMNFDGMPELHMRYGYPAVLALMAAVAIVIVLWFKQKKWI